MPSLADLFITAKLSDREVSKSARNIKSTLTRLDGTKVEPKVDLPDLTPQVRALQGKLAALNRTQIRLNVDSALAGTEVTTLRKQLEDLRRRRVEVPVELASKIDAEIAQVTRELDQAERRETTLPLKLERIDARVAAVKTQLAKLERDPVDIPVDVDERRTLRSRIVAVRTQVSEGLREGMQRSGEESGSRYSRGLSAVLKPSISALAVGMASGLATVGVGEFINEAKTAASDLTETVSQSGVVFGRSAADIQSWSRTSATSLGLSQRAALAAATGYGDMFTQLGYTEEQAAATSKQVVQFASDLGSFKNKEPTDVLERISAALRGEYDSLQALIPNINAARVEQEALTATGKDSAAALTAQEKATATLAIIQRDGAKAQGDFARTSGENANQQRILNAQLEDVQARLGQQVIPLFLSGTKAANQFLTEMQNGTGAGGDFVNFLKGAGEAGQAVMDVLRPLGGFLGSTFFGSTESATVAVGALMTVMSARKLQDFAAGLDAVASRGGRVGSMAGGLSRSLSFLGGPWGIAVGVGVTALTALITKETQAAKEAQSFTDSLTYQKGALDAASQAAIAKKLADEGALDTARAANVAETEYVKALVAGGPARDRMIQQLTEQGIKARANVDSYQGDILAQEELANASFAAADKLRVLGSAMDTSSRNAEVAKLVTDALGESQRNTGTSTASLSELQGELKRKTEDLKSKTDALISSYTILRGDTISSEEAALNFESALDRVAEATGAATKASKDNSSSLNVGTERGRQNREAVLGMVRALNDDVTATFKAGAEKGNFSKAQQNASEKLRTGRARLLDSAEAAGLNRGEVRRMIEQMLKTPKELETEVNAPGLDGTRTDVKDLDKRINDLNNKGVTVDTKIKFSPDKLAASMIKGDYFNNPGAFKVAGGPIQNLSGRGVKGKDTEHIIGAVGEHMLTSREVDAVGGHSTVYQIRKGMLSGELAGYTAGQALRPMVDGGAVERLIRLHSRSDRIPKRAISELMPGLARLSGSAGLAYADDIGVKWAKAAKAKYEKEMANGPVGGGSYAGALAWFRTQDPKPYRMGAVGPGSYDCSGAMSAIQNFILGRPIHQRRYSTGNFSGGPARMGGLTRNKVSPFRIGVIPTAGGKIGHMAGTLNGVNVESAGGVGVRLGRSARGWNDGLFRYHYGLADGGPVIQGDLPFDTLDRRGERFDAALRGWLGMLDVSAELATGAVVKGGRGGVTARIGEGGRDELVAPLPRGFDLKSQQDSLAELVDLLKSGRLGTTIQFGDIINPREEPLSQTANRLLQRVASLPTVD